MHVRTYELEIFGDSWNSAVLCRGKAPLLEMVCHIWTLQHPCLFQASALRREWFKQTGMCLNAAHHPRL